MVLCPPPIIIGTSPMENYEYFPHVSLHVTEVAKSMIITLNTSSEILSIIRYLYKAINEKTIATRKKIITRMIFILKN